MNQTQDAQLDYNEDFPNKPPVRVLCAVPDAQTAPVSLVSCPKTPNFPGMLGLVNQMDLLDMNSK